MTKRMLIDATHAEETRVVVLDGNRLDDFDVETSTKKQLKGNIYLAKIVRVEPSLQAAFVEYGGGRHGFLAFGEIHPDYYQIPVADRQRLLAMQAQEAREEEEAEDRAAIADGAASDDGATTRAYVEVAEFDADGSVAEAEQPHPADADLTAESEAAPEPAEPEPAAEAVEPESVPHAPVEVSASELHTPPHDESDAHASSETPRDHASSPPDAEAAPEGEAPPPRPAQAAMIPQDVRFGDEVFEPGLSDVHVPGAGSFEDIAADPHAAAPPAADMGETETLVSGADEPGFAPSAETTDGDTEAHDFDAPAADLPPPETIGGENDTSDSADEMRQRRSMRLLRNYRIQEVIRRRQIILVQVVKEERGNKGAALTTYISLAGRFCVLMPNSPRGGGISRKITSAADRRRLKEVTAELDLPQGMGLIVRTAGAARPKPEIKRDAEYLMRLWDDIREHTMKSVAPALIYEEASLIKRCIRDVYSRDVDEVLVDGEEGWRSAHDFMRMLMPSHAKKVQLWRPNGGTAPQPLFSKFAVEAQLDAMLSPTVQLKSGGYLVINQTEALVAIDVNSGRSTRERGIEETALRTNLEASDEIARQLRLRDLAGLIVIDYIDMEARKHNAAVERRLTDALKNDRARIQVGHISHFGLMEMSRQRLRPSLAETSFVTCSHCQGAGLVRSVESAAVHVLRAIEDEGAKAKASLIMVHCANAIAMYLLNNKRDRLGEIEARYAMRVHFSADESLAPPEIRIDRVKPQVADAERVLVAPVLPAAPAFAAEDEAEEAADEVFEEPAQERPRVAPTPRAEMARPERQSGVPVDRPAAAPETAGESEESVRRRRRRRRRGGRRDGSEPLPGAMSATGEADTQDDQDAGSVPSGEDAGSERALEAASPASVSPAPAISEPAASELVAAEVQLEVISVSADEQPSLDPTDLDENGLPRARRRGRRGGRRRRREGVGDETVGEADVFGSPVAAPPAYVGPTPADPFGGHAFDIFDMMDEVESRPLATSRPDVPPAVPIPVQASLAIDPPAPSHAAPEAPPADDAIADAPVVAAAAPSADVTTAPAAPEPAVIELDTHEPVAAEPIEAPPPGDAEPAQQPKASAPDTTAGEPEPAAEPSPAPLIQPIVIGQDDAPPAEPKKGWWRR